MMKTVYKVSSSLEAPSATVHITLIYHELARWKCWRTHTVIFQRKHNGYDVAKIHVEARAPENFCQINNGVPPEMEVL